MIKVPTDNLQGLKAWARGFEPPTFWSVAKRSIQLSYAHIKHKVIYNDIHYSLVIIECQDNILTYFESNGLACLFYLHLDFLKYPV